MDFECNFNDLNFCEYSNLGWGFQKSVKYRHQGNAALNLRNSPDYFPCSVSNSAKEGSRLEKRFSLNTTQDVCLRFAYLLEERGYITVTNGNNNWSKIANDKYVHWDHMRFPIDFHKVEHLKEIGSDTSVLKITGESVCVDNFTISTHPCPLTTTIFDNSFSSNPTIWLTQPFSVLVAIITMVFLFIIIGVISSIMFARKSQQAHCRVKQPIRKLKRSQTDWVAFPNSLEHGTTLNSCNGIETMESNRVFAHNNRCLPSIVHVHSNPQLVRYSRQSFAASSSAGKSDSTHHFRFSLSLTEDAQVQLLMPNNTNSNAAISAVKQHSLISSRTHESSHKPKDNIRNENPVSVFVTPTFCTPIVDQSESDSSTEYLNINPSIHNTGKLDRHRPIRESMNIGYVSDASLCDLPQYDTAVQLLVEQKIKLAQSSDFIDNNDEDNDNNNDIVEDF